MKRNYQSIINVSGRIAIAILSVSMISFLPLRSQIKYTPLDERKDAGMGVERVARFFTPAYESKVAKSDNEVRWVQVDLGERKKIDCIKLLPRVNPWGYVSSIGFPSRFKIEVSDDKDFGNSIMYENWTREDFRDPYDEIITFKGEEVYGRYLRLTALRLRQQRLALSKISIMSEGQEISAGCPSSDSESGDLPGSVLTRHDRPLGEGVVTDNPENIIPAEKWKPVAYKAQTPKGGVEIGEGLIRRTMENNISYLMNSFTFDELVRNFRVKAGKPVQPLEERLNNFWFVDLPGQEAGRFPDGSR